MVRMEIGDPKARQAGCHEEGGREEEVEGEESIFSPQINSPPHIFIYSPPPKIE